MVKIVKTSLPRQIADNIETRIKKGQYKVGDKLPTEPELVKEYGVSRNTLREAIGSLTNSGILETRQGDGTYVVAKERFEVEFVNAMESTTNKNVLEVRNMLENSIIVTAIANATDKDIDEIEHYLTLRKQTRATVRENTEADLDYHFAIARATHNDLLIAIYRYVSEYFNEFIYDIIYSKKQDQEYIDGIHDQLFEAVKNRDKELGLDCINKIIKI